jgi:hypothetical protein
MELIDGMTRAVKRDALSQIFVVRDVTAIENHIVDSLY